MFDLIIIGGASAGLSASIYAARKKLNFTVLTSKIGGQSLLTDNIENYPGFKSISGFDFVKKVRDHAESLGVEIKEGIEIEGITKNENSFSVKAKNGEVFEAKTIIVASGKNPRHLNVPGEKEFTGKGVSFCSICDAPLFEGKNVAVIGGGNAGLETAIDLTKYAEKIYVLESVEKITGDESTVDKLKASGKVEFITNASIKEIKGGSLVEKLVYNDKTAGEEKELGIEGVFVNVGQIPNSAFLGDFLKLNEKKEIIIDARNNTSVDGVFAAGDVTDVPYKQCVISAGEGAKAALSVYDCLQGLKHN